VTAHPIHRLDDAVHQRVRLGILAACVGVSKVDFSHLKATLGLTDGNLGRHLETLETAGLIVIERLPEGRRHRTWIKVTRTGRQALRREITALKELIDLIDNHAVDEHPKTEPATKRS
jgi:DNA-binding MarR family transcriptional regulator